ncbi:MAG: DUF1254 domain-containing protein [Sandaracinobacter sp.]
MSDLTAAEAKAIAGEAWAWGLAPVILYETLYTQAVDAGSPSYVGGFNAFRHYDRQFTSDDRDIRTPNNDTPYSWAWLDLRAEPIVFSVPAVPDRYYVNQWVDLYTHNFAYTGTRATGTGAGTYLFAGPGWHGEVPADIDGVFRAETDIVMTLTRTGVDGAADIPAMKAVQAGYRLTPLAAFLGVAAPAPAPALDWPAWDKAKAEGLGFIGYLNALLRCMPAVASEAEMLARFARIGIGAGLPFDADALAPDIRAAMKAGIAEARQAFEARAVTETDSMAFFGTRAELGADYVYNRNVGAALGVLGNTKEEAIYLAQQTEPDGSVLDGTRRWRLRFEPGALPPVDFFWSLTMYALPDRNLVPNPIGRYSIGDRTPGLKPDADGGLSIWLQPESPGPERESNWLPTPAGPFFFVARLYGPRAEALDKRWGLPPLEKLG